MAMYKKNMGAEGPKRSTRVSAAQRAKAKSRTNLRSKSSFTTRDEKGRVTSRRVTTSTRRNASPATASKRASARAMGAEGPKRSMPRKKK